MAQKKTTEIRLVLPSLDKLRDDVESSVESLGKRAADMLPKSSRRQLDDTVDRLQKVRKDTEKRLQKARKDLDKQVASVRKDVDKRTRGVVGTIEREARKQIEALYKRLNLPVQSDINSLKRRLTGIERKLDQLLKEQQSKKAAA